MATFADLVLNICSISLDDFARVTPSSRSRQMAERNLQANRAALAEIWPQALRLVPDELPMAEYLFSRDGALTAKFDDGRWFGGCSVPKRAARHSLARFEMTSSAATLLAPQHPQVIALVLEKMRSDQALVTIIPQDDTFAFTLCLHDFSDAIRARRLWFAPGLDWTRALVELLDKLPGLPPPTQLIRVGSTTRWLSDRVQQLADAAIVRSTRARADSMARLANRRRAIRKIDRLCVIGSSRFNLWCDTHHWLLARHEDLRKSFDVTPVDLADPVRRSNYFVATQLDRCDAVLSAEIGRSDQPGIASMAVPWITLCSQRVPMFAGAGVMDRVMLCSQDLHHLALKNGWPDKRIDRVSPLHAARHAPAGRVAIIADLDPICEPAIIEAYSSHQALWQALTKRLNESTFVPQLSPANLIAEAATKFGIDPEQLPLEIFLNRLITPAWMVCVARRLKSADIDFVIHGSGWETQADLQDHWRGPVTSVDDFSRAIAETGRLLDVWPSQLFHPARNVGLDVVPTWGDPVRQLRSSTLLARRSPGSSQSLSIDDVTRILSQLAHSIEA